MIDVDAYEIVQPMSEKVSPAACLGFRVLRATCPCCGGSFGVRKALNKSKCKRAKPRYKNHRDNLI